MDFEKAAEIAVRDPLSDATRKERKSLLGVGIVGIALVKAELIPTKISALGVEFSEANQKYLFYIAAAIVMYYVVAFIAYALSDFIAWKIAFWNAIKSEMDTAIRLPSPSSDTDEVNALKFKLQNLDRQLEEWKRGELKRQMGEAFLGRPLILMRMSGWVSFFRALVEFVLPMLVGGYAFYLLVFFR